MPRIDSQPTTKKYLELCSAAFDRGESNDCTVKAIAVVTGVEYAVAHRAMAEQGRKTGSASYFDAVRKALKSIGFKLSSVDSNSFIKQYPKGHRDVLKNVTTHHPQRFNKVWKDGNNYLFSCSGHIAGVVDGTMHDWAHSRALRVYGIYRVEKE